GIVRFTNLTSSVVLERKFSLRVAQPDYFTEIFTNNADLDNQSFTFTPNGSPSFYSVCREAAASFPTDPSGGTSVTLTDDSFAMVTISGTNRVRIYDRSTNVFYIGSNGYITFDDGDIANVTRASFHFSRPRIAAFMDDFLPATG